MEDSAAQVFSERDRATLAERYREVRERIASAAGSAGRDVAEIELIVVSKFHPAQLVLALLELGQSQFGENRDQEAAPKAAEVAARLGSLTQLTPLPTPTWHFIGQLQSNKVRSVLGYSNIIHSLDRPSLLKELGKQAARRSEEAAAISDNLPAPIEVFIELNLTGDPGRGGLDPAELEPFAAEVVGTEGLALQGVMGVAGLGQDPEPDFQRLAAAAERLRALHPDAKYLSMGMSGDYELAISLGATHLRIGSAITGNRH